MISLLNATVEGKHRTLRCTTSLLAAIAYDDKGGIHFAFCPTDKYHPQILTPVPAFDVQALSSHRASLVPTSMHHLGCELFKQSLCVPGSLKHISFVN